MTAKLRLKSPENGEYDMHICAASKCGQPSMLIDGTKKLSKENIPLCEKHWIIRSEMVTKNEH